MSQTDEDRARQQLADNMKEASARVKADAAASEARKKHAKKKVTDAKDSDKK